MVDDMVDTINGYVFALIALGLLTPLIVIRSVRTLLGKTPPQDNDLPDA
jgi:uncharacterized membrane protein YjgN (DUF898 family)